MAEPYGEGYQSVTISEHISPRKTGDNIEAKRVAGYVFNPTTLEWQRDTNVDPATSANQDQANQLLDQLIIDTQILQRITQALQTVDSLQRLRVSVDNISGTTLGTAVGAGFTNNAPSASQSVSTGNTYFTGVYEVGIDWREKAAYLANVPFNQMLDRIYIS